MKKLLTKRTAFIVVVLLLAILFGNLQERIKLSLNNIIRYSNAVEHYDSLSSGEREEAIELIIASQPPDFFSTQSSLGFLFRYERSELNRIKWIIAFAFIGVFFILNTTLLYLAFRDKKLIQFLAIATLVICALSGFFYFFGSLVGMVKPGYGVARKLLGGLQSLVPVMLIYPAYHVYLLSKKSEAEQ